MRRAFLGALVAATAAMSVGCSQTPQRLTVPPADSVFLNKIKGMPVGAERVEAIVAHLRAAHPEEAMSFDLLEAELRADEAAAATRWQDRVVVIAGVRFERAWSAKEDHHGITTANVIGRQKMVNRGFRFGQADEARVLTATPGRPLTAVCLLLEAHLDPAGCILLID